LNARFEENTKKPYRPEKELNRETKDSIPIKKLDDLVNKRRNILKRSDSYREIQMDKFDLSISENRLL